MSRLVSEEQDVIGAFVDLAQQTKDNLEGLAYRRRILFLRLSHAPLKKARAIGNPSQRAAGFFRAVLRIDGESLEILAGQARLLERVNISEKVYLSSAAPTESCGKVLCYELAELSLRQKRDGIVQHVEDVFTAHPANGSPELVPIDMLAGHGPPFPPVWYLLVYCLILSCWKEPGWDTTAGFADANVRTSGFPAKVTKSMYASVARPGRRASARLLRTRTTSSLSLSNRVSPKRTWPTLN
jgi:hypothetical protein